MDDKNKVDEAFGYYDEFVEKDLKHSAKWEPLYRYRVPHSIKPRDYRELIGEIERLICEWTWDMVYMCSNPDLCKELVDFHKGLYKYERMQELLRNKKR